MMALAFGGIAFGRFGGIIVDGAGTPSMLLFASLEAFGMGLRSQLAPSRKAARSSLASWNERSIALNLLQLRR